MKTSRMIAILVALMVCVGGCSLRSQFTADVRGEYRPTYLVPSQDADMHVSWKLAVD